MRAVVDTNVIISAQLVEGSTSDRVLSQGYARVFSLISSRALIAELARVIRRPQTQSRLGWTEHVTLTFLHDFETSAIVVEPEIELDSIVRDAADHRILEAAIAGEADYIVSGDKDLLVLESYDGVPIVTPTQFLVILATLSDR
ncbi:MAG: putative toxin-antitoxin system toxin component, PIN family [Dehalococcoidia bacterium]|nr:putative toxin-antitoxin system toxin component, PIN family [Dehalococcoidia bacterium]